MLNSLLIPEARPVPWLGRPTLFDEELETVWAGGGDGELEGVAPHPPDNGGAVHVLVGYLTGEQLPDTDTKRPDVNLENFRIAQTAVSTKAAGVFFLLAIIMTGRLIF